MIKTFTRNGIELDGKVRSIALITKQSAIVAVTSIPCRYQANFRDPLRFSVSPWGRFHFEFVIHFPRFPLCTLTGPPITETMVLCQHSASKGFTPKRFMRDSDFTPILRPMQTSVLLLIWHGASQFERCVEADVRRIQSFQCYYLPERSGGPHSTPREIFRICLSICNSAVLRDNLRRKYAKSSQIFFVGIFLKDTRRVRCWRAVALATNFSHKIVWKILIFFSNYVSLLKVKNDVSSSPLQC